MDHLEIRTDERTPRVNTVIGFTAPEIMLNKMTLLAQEMEIELSELTHIFELQRKREQVFIEMWRSATGKENSIPDYGEFLKWLLDLLDRERAITGEQREIIGTLKEEYKKLETTTVKLTQTNVELREVLDDREKEVLSLKQELTHVRPQADCYVRILQSLCIDKDVLGYINSLNAQIKSLEDRLEGLEHHETSIRY